MSGKVPCYTNCTLTLYKSYKTQRVKEIFPTLLKTQYVKKIWETNKPFFTNVKVPMIRKKHSDCLSKISTYLIKMGDDLTISTPRRFGTTTIIVACVLTLLEVGINPKRIMVTTSNKRCLDIIREKFGNSVHGVQFGCPSTPTRGFSADYIFCDNLTLNSDKQGYSFDYMKYFLHIISPVSRVRGTKTIVFEKSNSFFDFVTGETINLFDHF